MDFSKAKTEAIGHLGLVAATIQDTGIMEKIDDQLGMKKNGVSYGKCVGAMILNGLGFINTALYMTPRFFHDKPLSLLLGEDITAEQLNDDCLGRCLDEIATYDSTKFYSEIALELIHREGLMSNTIHIDSTTFSLYGDYNQSDQKKGLKPVKGYSKDHRPDLNQVTLQLVSLGKNALPIWMESLDGNSSDKSSFPKTVKRVNEVYQKIASAPRMCFIGDSALYGNQLDELNTDWITRVPGSFGECKSLCDLCNVSWSTTSDERYQCFSYQPQDSKQRWLLVRSEPAFHRENETFLRRHEQNFEELKKSLWHCSCQNFHCEKDAQKAINKVIQAKKHFYNVDYKIIAEPKFNTKGRPKKNQVPDGYIYKIVILGIASDYEVIMKKRALLGRFVLATNILDKESLSDECILFNYKGQSAIEQNFRFIKNDTFGLDDIYLKKPERISALMAVMTLCLLIYGLTQYHLREALSKNNEVLPDQKGKPTQTPTLMWIFTLFASITTIAIPESNGCLKRIVMNIQPLHQKVILLLGDTAKKIYLLDEQLSLHGVELNQKTWLKWCGM